MREASGARKGVDRSRVRSASAEAEASRLCSDAREDLHCGYLDNREMFLGSVNLTHNGLENNKEHLLKISESAIVDKVTNDFQETWEMAEEVAPEMILEMIERDQKRKLKKHERQVQDREKPMSKNSRSGRRSSSESLDGEASETLL